MTNNDNACTYGLIAEFESAKGLVYAAEQTRKAGYRRFEAYSPYWVEGLSDAMGTENRTNFLPWLVLAGLILGALGGFFLQYWLEVPQYALNIGGRPYNSWPAFMIITFEAGILGAGLSALLGMVALSGIPQPYHPVFNAPNIELASRSRFFLCIEVMDNRFDLERTRQFLQDLGPTKVSEVTC